MNPSVVTPLTVTVGTWVELRAAAQTVRLPVFVGEQGIPEHLEMDDHDPVAVHAVVCLPDGQAVATGRLLTDGRIGRMAVLPAYRNRGLGAQVLAALLAAAEARGQHRQYLHAQMRAVPFYQRHGFTSVGASYLEAGIEHCSMERHTRP
jgi:predicted GNAT family N-acyltransferase